MGKAITSGGIYGNWRVEDPDNETPESILRDISFCNAVELIPGRSWLFWPDGPSGITACVVWFPDGENPGFEGTRA